MLTDKQIQKASGRDKVYKLYDEKGLVLRVKPSGSKSWEFKYRVDGPHGRKVEKLLPLGIYGEVSLKEARAKCLDARKLLGEGKDPSEARKNHPVWAGLGDLTLFEDALGINYWPYWLGCEGNTNPVSRQVCKSIGILDEQGNWTSAFSAPGCELPTSPTPTPVSPEQQSAAVAWLKEFKERFGRVETPEQVEERKAAAAGRREAGEAKRQKYCTAVRHAAEGTVENETRARFEAWLVSMSD